MSKFDLLESHCVVLPSGSTSISEGLITINFFSLFDWDFLSVACVQQILDLEKFECGWHVT